MCLLTPTVISAVPVYLLKPFCLIHHHLFHTSSVCWDYCSRLQTAIHTLRVLMFTACALGELYLYCLSVRIMIVVSGRLHSRLLSSWCWKCVGAWLPFWRAWWDTGSCPSVTLTHLQPLPRARPSKLHSHPINSLRLSVSARMRSLMWVILTPIKWRAL